MIIMVIFPVVFRMLCFPGFLTVSYCFPGVSACFSQCFYSFLWCFSYFPAVFPVFYFRLQACSLCFVNVFKFQDSKFKIVQENSSEIKIIKKGSLEKPHHHPPPPQTTPCIDLSSPTLWWGAVWHYSLHLKETLHLV